MTIGNLGPTVPPPPPGEADGVEGIDGVTRGGLFWRHSARAGSQKGDVSGHLMQFPVAESYTGVGSVQSFGMGAHTNARGSFPRRE